MLEPQTQQELLNKDDVITQQNYFTINDEILIQRNGLAMGVTISEFLLQNWEHLHLAHLHLAHLHLAHLHLAYLHLAHLSNKHKITSYLRYVDGNLLIFDSNHTNIQKILDYFNTVHRNLQFTAETEKVHYRTHKRPPPVSILGQPNPVHIPTSHLLEIHPNINHPSKPRSPQWSLRFPQQDPIHPLSSPIRATCPAHLILLDFITRTILGEGYKTFSSSLCSLLHSAFTSPLLGPNILLSTMFLNILNFLSSRRVNDQVSHPYKQQAKSYTFYK